MSKRYRGLLAVCLLFGGFPAMPGYAEEASEGAAFYVALNGSDSNPIGVQGYFNVYHYAGSGNAIELKAAKPK